MSGEKVSVSSAASDSDEPLSFHMLTLVLACVSIVLSPS